MDFLHFDVKKQTSNNRTSDFVVTPDFLYGNTSDLICKGGYFFAFWYNNQWYTSMDDLITAVDKEGKNILKEFIEKRPGSNVTHKMMRTHSSNVMKEFMAYTKNQPQSDVIFNSKIFFSDQTPKKEDYVTTQLSYTPKPGPTPSFDEMFNTLYEPEELEKILWCVGATLTNNMEPLHKFLFLYGAAGTGKGTAIKLLKKLFEGYHAPISLEYLTSGAEFATGQIKEMPVLIDDDTNLNNIKSDISLLKLTAHEPLIINNKYSKIYESTFKGLLIAASNQPYQVRNIDAGINRRAIVVRPTKNKIASKRYFELMNQINFELPHIAQKAIDIFYDKGMYYYENYIDVKMMEQTDHFYAFFKETHKQLGDPCTLKKAAELYKLYLEDIGFETRGYKKKVRLELQRYYHNFDEYLRINDQQHRNVYSGIKLELLNLTPEVVKMDNSLESFGLVKQPSKLDSVMKDYPAQLANEEGLPNYKWDNVKTTLKDIDTSKLHYVRVPLNHIVIDFDIKDENGNKSLSLNLEKASQFPPTYTEVSKSGQGVHLHYFYDGDVTKLEALYEDDIEVKVFTGKQSLRRKLTLCNDLDMSYITSGLPEKKPKGVTMFTDVEFITWDEKKLRTAIKGNLEKKYHPNTKPSVHFIEKILKEAEEKGVKYDLRDMKDDCMKFAARSTNHDIECIKIISGLNFCTVDEAVQESVQSSSGILPKEKLTFYDIEVFPNLFIICYKHYGEDKVYRMINPTAEEVEEFCKYNLVGFNNRRYDNHIVYGAMLGLSPIELYRQSQRIINGEGNSAFYSGAYELSYTDIYDFAATKQSLKKWEIELGLPHVENELPWDQPVPEHLWEQIAEYCDNDVLATEAVFNHLEGDYIARCILSELSGLSPNSTNNQHSTKIIFGDDPAPQKQFNYYHLSKEFPGYTFEYGKSKYRDIDPGEGGYVYTKPGVYRKVALIDVKSMHPSTIIAINYFGKYTQRFAELVKARLYIKEKNYEPVKKMFDGKLAKYLNDTKTANQLGYALKIVINSVYGLTAARFPNKFKHEDNIDNIIAKRGALFMIDLLHAVIEQGYEVIHIKTDSIKIANADEYIIKFIMDFGKKYGYEFDHEATYEKIALVNKADYIAKDEYGWHATGSKFSEPFVYKTLFTKEEIDDKDFGQVKQAKDPIYLGEKFIGKLANVYASVTGEELVKKVSDKNHAIQGAKGYGWKLMENYTTHTDVDMQYYEKMVEEAKDAINSVGSYDDLMCS